VLAEQRRLSDRLERDPIRFLAPERELEPKLDHVRELLSDLVGIASNDMAFVRNATDGVNAVVRSLSLQPSDEIVITNHGYNACNNAVRFATERVGAVTRVANIPFPISDSREAVDAIASELSDRTRLILVDHVSSSTGLVFPVETIIAMAHKQGVRVMIDGAHAPGMMPLNLTALNPDYYTANHHKWLCGPKASGFLYVRSNFQDEVHPTVISHGFNRSRPNRSRFLGEFDWMGTHDPTPLMSMPAAIEFLNSLFPGGINELMETNRELALQSRDVLCDALKINPPSPDEMIGSLVSVPLNGMDLKAGENLGRELYNRHQIEVPIFSGVSNSIEKTESIPYLRVSLQVYNHIEQVERLAKILCQYSVNQT